MTEMLVRNAAVESALGSRATGGTSTSTPTQTETRLTPPRLVIEAGAVRSMARTLQSDADDLHKRSLEKEWRTKAAERCKTSVTSMLVELADLGFAWRDIARMVGVSVPAVQKWRKGEKASGDSRMRIASLLAACDLIANHYMVEEVASWFETPLSSAAPVTPIALYADSRPDLVFELASGHVDPEALLTEFDPDWRERYQSGFEVFEAGDGNHSIRMKD